MSKQRTAQEVYAARYAEAQALLETLQAHLDDLPAPSETFEPHWGHVGDLGRLNELFNEALMVLGDSK